MSSVHRRGFTLLELMVAVAIIGLLAALAIPNYLQFQLRARTTEAKANLAAIRTAEDSYFVEYHTFVAAAVTPALAPGVARHSWPSPGPGCPSCFDVLGWSPEGEVYFQYEVVAAAASGAPGLDVFTAAAGADLDGDGTGQLWGYVRALPDRSNGQASTLAGGAGATPCPGTGTWNETLGVNDRLDTVGPCDPTSGQTSF
jgi:type IV pilus assembly protein PilA